MHPTMLSLARLRAVVAPRLVPPLVAVFLLTSGGCLATKVKVDDGGGADHAGLLVRVYADADAAKAGRTAGAGTLVELFALDKRGKEVFLQRSMAGEWGVDKLPPGKYRLRVVAVIDGAGHIRDAKPGDRDTEIELTEGQTAEVSVILKKTPTGLIVAAAVTVVVLVVALALLLDKNQGKLPAPRLPSPPHGVPPPVPLRAVVIAPEIWVEPAWGPPPPGHTAASPRVTSVVPEPGSTVPDRHVIPTLTFSQPINESRIAPGAVRMLGSKSGLIPGRTVAVNGLLRFEPSRDLSPAETVTVTVQASGIASFEGRHLEKDFSWSFQTE